MVPRSLCIKLNAIFAIVLLRFEYVLGTCIERDEQIQKYLSSSQPPFDNYFNISKAVYPFCGSPIFADRHHGEIPEDSWRKVKWK